MLVHIKDGLLETTTLPYHLIDDDTYLMGLARHYNAPTRVLDWTRSPYVAVYFACEPFWGKPYWGDGGAKNDEISVFAVGNLANSEKATLLEPRGSANPKLRAQHGVLVLHEWEHPDLWDDAYNEVVKSDDISTDHVPDEVGDYPCFYIRVDCSAFSVDQMWIELSRMGIDARSIYPGNLGVITEATRLAFHHEPHSESDADRLADHNDNDGGDAGDDDDDSG